MSAPSAVYLRTCDQVVLHTSFGDLDVELWPKEAPKVSSNLLAKNAAVPACEMFKLTLQYLCRQCATSFSSV